MIDHRHTEFTYRPEGVHPADMSTEKLAAAGLRWATKEEYAAACALRDNFADPASAERFLPAALPMARMRLEAAISDLEQLQYELKTRHRRMTTVEGLAHEVPSPYFCDGQGRSEDHWRTEAAQAKAELARLVKAGAPRDEVDLESRCYLRLQEASASNTGDRIAHNSVLLRQAVAGARNMVQLRQAEFEDLSRRARPYMDSGQ